MEERLSAIDKILDENNTDNIVLYNAKDEQVEFEQIALIPLDGEMYVILSPVSEIPGVGEDEGLVFRIAEDEDGMKFLSLIHDTETVDEVFEIYDALLDEEPDAETDEADGLTDIPEQAAETDAEADEQGGTAETDGALGE